MNALTGLAWLLLFQSFGEVIARGAHTGLPKVVRASLLMPLVLKLF